MDHGGARKSEMNLLDFSYSSNPYKPPFLGKALKSAKIDRYPYCEEDLELKIKEKFKIKGEVSVAAGITEQLYIIFNIFKHHRFVIPAYTYSEYERVANIIGVKYRNIKVKDLTIDNLNIKREEVLLISNPNNPTGKYYDFIGDLVENSVYRNFYVVIDEAFIDFVGPKVKKIDINDNTIIMRSFSKSYNISGVRTGYSIATDKFAKLIRNTRMPWGIGSLGCSLIEGIIRDKIFLNYSLAKIFSERERIMAKTGLKTDANYFLAKVGNGTAVKNELRKKGILVRDCTSFKFPDSIRFSIKKIYENNRLLEALDEFEVSQPDGINF
ncbi:MAG: aminotransferase class I/II-fold pyridoxal phosphate-dependent enzyme [Thermoplasmata archaeon]